MNISLLVSLRKRVTCWYLNQGQTDTMAREDRWIRAWANFWYQSQGRGRPVAGPSKCPPLGVIPTCIETMSEDSAQLLLGYIALHCHGHGWMKSRNSCSFIHLKIGSRQDWFSSYVWIISTHRLTLDERSWGHCRQHSLNRLRLVITSTYFSSESINRNQGLTSMKSPLSKLRCASHRSRAGEDDRSLSF